MGNRIKLTDLNGMSDDALRGIPPDMLRELQNDLKTEQMTLDLLKGRVNRAFQVRYGDTMEGAREKDTGVCRILDGDYEIIQEIPKRVDWDQKKLNAVLDQLHAEGDNPYDYVEVKVKVPERKWAVWPQSVRDRFLAARQEKSGSPKWGVEWAK